MFQTINALQMPSYIHTMTPSHSMNADLTCILVTAAIKREGGVILMTSHRLTIGKSDQKTSQFLRIGRINPIESQ